MFAPSPVNPVRVDLRDTLEPIDPLENSWVKQWNGLAPIHQRGFNEFEVVSWEVRYRLGRTIGVVTILNQLSDWYDLEFVVESVRKSERKAGVDGYGALCRAIGVPARLDSPEKLVGRKAAFRVVTPEGDVEFKSLSDLEVPSTEFCGFLRKVAA